MATPKPDRRPLRDLRSSSVQNRERDQRWAEIQDSVWCDVFLRTSMEVRSTEPWKIVQIAQEKADETLTHLKRPKHLEHVPRSSRDPI